jgi:hypothetical protein
MILASHLLLSMPDMPEPIPVPEGYSPLVHGGPYFRALGAIHGRPAPDEVDWLSRCVSTTRT